MRQTFFLGLFGIMFAPTALFAASFDVAGWIPWWQYEEGIERVTDNIRDIDTIYPFVFEINEDRELENKVDFEEEVWDDLFDDAKRHNVEILPTIFWNDGDAIHEVLSDDDAREELIEAIEEMVDEWNVDGVNIDFESKHAETMEYFSDFLEELEDELGSDTLTCTIEARTPPASKWREVPEEIEYANDYRAMNRYCDRVEIMAYDQQRIDWRLNDEKSGEPYIPVADKDWVEKVIELALEDIDNDKIMLGVPTYGREWEITVAPNWFKEYRSIRAVNMPDAEETAAAYNLTPMRNKAGEQSYTYFPEDSPFRVLDVLPVPDSVSHGHRAAAQALLFATYTGMEVPVRAVWYSDARSVKDKIDLVEKYDLRGVAVFKFDGEEDEEIWELF